MLNTRFCIVRCVLGTLLVVAAQAAKAQTSPADGADRVAKSASRSESEAAIRQVAYDYLAALALGDAKALAEFWTKGGTFTDEGRTIRVQDLFASGAADQIARPQAIVSDRSFRFVTDDVAIEDGDYESPSAGSWPGRRHFEAVWVKDQGRWKLDSLRQTSAAPAVNQDQLLASLDVFAGQWSGEAEKSTVRVSAKWDANKKFLRREFSITSGKAELGGTQEIGWDPVSRSIKSWTFFADGSYSEGLWSRESNAWLVLSTRYLPDGTTSAATHIFKFPDRKTMIWKSVHGSVGGQATDDFEVTLRRAEPQK